MTHPHRTYRTEALTGWPTPATEILTERGRRAHEFYPDDQPAREAFLARVTRAIALVQILDQVLHGYRGDVDRAVTAGAADGLGWWDAHCGPRTEQEQVIAEWAFAYVDQDTTADLLEDLRILLVTSVGFDVRDTTRDAINRPL
ncbi:hypothetical protein [Nocardia miyunensis]|uniref:hypothetical protein n=1 Tax=Nocardia miyunensis TaxID=282684 RepID=UPI00082FE948|nr:hypothetical protein [Nocardia miyunensis]